MSNDTYQNDTLSAIGALLQYGVSEIPVIGGLLSTVISLLWPSADDNVWQSIKQEVQQLINESIDETLWNTLTRNLDDAREKMSTLNHLLTTANYDEAGSTLMTTINIFDGKQDQFQIDGRTFKYAFAPLFVAMMNLKICLYLEGLKYAKILNLTNEDIALIKYLLEKDVRNAKKYLSPISAELSTINLTDIQTYVNISLYYKTSVELFNTLWSGNYEDYKKSIRLDNYYVPVIAGGSFYKFVELDGLSYSVPMPFAEAVENSIKPSSNINGIESHDNASYPSGLLNYINIYTDESSMHRPTGLSFKCNGSSTKYSMGIISDNDESVHLGQHIFTLNNGEYINDVSVYSSQFVSKIEFKTNRRAFIVGQNPDYDNVQSVSLVNPFTVNSMYVPSDIAGYVNSSGHQMCGIVVSAIYNNEIARQYVSSLYK